MRHTEATKETQANSDVTLMHFFFFSRGVLTIFTLKRIVLTGSIYSVIFILNKSCGDDDGIAA